MKREEKNELSRRRILEAASAEFAENGYDAASLNTICAKYDISKGIIYHYFRDKDELYLLCAASCYERLTACLTGAAGGGGTAAEKLQNYFDVRIKFFAENPRDLGIFLDTTLTPPAHLAAALADIRRPFDGQNIRILTDMLQNAPLRDGLSVPALAEDFRTYMDYFNARFRAALSSAKTPRQAIAEHEERCRRQVGILLYGVLERKDE